MQFLTHSSRKAGHHALCGISIVAGRVNKKAGSYVHDVYLAAAWMLQQGIRGNKTTWGKSIHISQIMW